MVSGVININEFGQSHTFVRVTKTLLVHHAVKNIRLIATLSDGFQKLFASCICDQQRVITNLQNLMSLTFLNLLFLLT